MPTTPPSVIIIGAGFGGLGMAMELRRSGFDNFTILERAAETGGTGRSIMHCSAMCRDCVWRNDSGFGASWKSSPSGWQICRSCGAWSLRCAT